MAAKQRHYSSTLWLVALLGVLLPNASSAQQDSEPYCPELVDRPLTALSVDISPVDKQGEAVPVESLPDSCWASAGREFPAVFVGCVASCRHWDARCLLQLARFRHPYVYFEDERLERCGETGCLPNLCSAGKFLCDLAVLPVQLIAHCPRKCVCSPTPHTCQTSACGSCR